MDTVDQQNALRQAAQKRIKASHALDGDADRLAQYYREWADSYELDVAGERYCGPSIVAELAGVAQAAYIGSDRAATAILDAGCGTGLVGIQLEHLGFRLIDGFDLSGAMAEMARQTGVYRNVEDGIDLNRPLSDYSSASYDVTVCCGVFTLGHVHPDGLRELARVTRPNGFVIASTCKSSAGAMSFEVQVLSLQEAGVLTPAQCLNGGRFLGEEDAHYWVLRVLDKPAELRL
ncbi:SAM-dependent methyltransferase protein (plasmid) [Rhizobium gallicum bv. gallicum R602sp]|uniref:SAM-dependent methyltransferase protein n=2 Tax=Rhizobium gallicum TaxID=56730 RepID=A0A0B4X736_9HYPH|nr:SAM-dependent methyltransferase protein [Rhizobium gallicum bv. gallicum R602sp]TDW16933.1 methyltransferase family protein [Rhizobium azibense]